MWNELKAVALKLIRSDQRFKNETEEHLIQWVLDTGYTGGWDSHKNTVDLVYVFAASLYNSGARGPNFERFAGMIAAAISTHTNENVIQSTTVQDLAASCLKYLNRPGVNPLVDTGTVDYRNFLDNIANGSAIDSSRNFPNFLETVVQFIDLLVKKYEGTAKCYCTAFAERVDATQLSNFIQEKYSEIAEFKQVGVAVAMNFFKDSQVAAFRHENFENIFNRNAGWFVKPDMHVLRLMLCATGRAEAANLKCSDLLKLKAADAARIYNQNKSTQIFEGTTFSYHKQPRNEHGMWKCIQDVHKIASINEIAPLGYDRLLYLIGSGNYRQKLNIPKTERYNLFCEQFCNRSKNSRIIVNVFSPVEAKKMDNRTSESDIQDNNNTPIDAEAEQNFSESIQESLAARELVKKVIELCKTTGIAQVHYSKKQPNGDLRVVARKPVLMNHTITRYDRQIVTTMQWTKRNSRFSCQTLTSEQKCRNFGFSDNQIRKAKLKSMPTVLYIFPSDDSERFLKVVAASISQFNNS
jgi:hypothetical protein